MLRYILAYLNWSHHYHCIAARVAVAQSSSLSLFTNRDAELEQRAMLLKRLAFAIFSSEIDQYQKFLPDIQGETSLQNADFVSNFKSFYMLLTWRFTAYWLYLIFSFSLDAKQQIGQFGLTVGRSYPCKADYMQSDWTIPFRFSINYLVQVLNFF